MNTFDKFFVGSVSSFDGRVVHIREEVFSIEMYFDMFQEGNFGCHGLEGLSWDNFGTTKRLRCLSCVELVSVTQSCKRMLEKMNCKTSAKIEKHQSRCFAPHTNKLTF